MRFLIISGLLLVTGCEGYTQLCGRYACVSYHDECVGNHCFAERHCEAAGSTRDRLPAILNTLREAQRACSHNTSDEQTFTSLNWDEQLASASTLHARDMAQHNFESFVGSNGLNTTQRVLATGATAEIIAESIGSGPQTSAEMINTWLDVTTDCKQLLDPVFTRVGAACAAAPHRDRGPYWSLVLSGPEQTSNIRCQECIQQ